MIRRWSIVTKLTLFVGLLVALTAGTLITVGFQYTSGILQDQINNRLSAVADDRQASARWSSFISRSEFAFSPLDID